MAFTNFPKQQQAMELIRDNYTTLLEGGSRSGKTEILAKAMFIRAVRYSETKHLVARFHFKDAKQSLWYDSFPKVAKRMGINDVLKWNNQEFFITFPNGSQVWLGGLDDKQRTEKILGQEYATVWMNEASQISFGSYEIVRTRCNAPVGCPGKVLIDYNPPPKGHWGYKMFHERQLPDGQAVPDNDFAHLKMNPRDNPYLAAEYIEKNLMTLSKAKRIRFLDGEYGDEEGALWSRSWFKRGTAPVDRERVVIGVDPSGSRDGDEIGIIVASRAGDMFYVEDDLTLHGSPKEWGDAVMGGWEDYQGDCIAAEKNFGGDMVESTITDMGRRSVKVKLVTASRGKIVRAEPISALYENGRVFHCKEFTELENELVMFKGTEDEKSPNRLDALVWALHELGDSNLSLADVL
jgi:hypothetical protein